ncbi:MAG: hypothetical protein CL678_09735 [Bdellovibrionaceae bacterium]|nr:hypothetical protein [Pseudobdellovibrionaceae bacterium]
MSVKSKSLKSIIVLTLMILGACAPENTRNQNTQGYDQFPQGNNYVGPQSSNQAQQSYSVLYGTYQGALYKDGQSQSFSIVISPLNNYAASFQFQSSGALTNASASGYIALNSSLSNVIQCTYDAYYNTVCQYVFDTSLISMNQFGSMAVLTDNVDTIIRMRLAVVQSNSQYGSPAQNNVYIDPSQSLVEFKDCGFSGNSSSCSNSLYGISMYLTSKN